MSQCRSPSIQLKEISVLSHALVTKLLKLHLWESVRTKLLIDVLITRATRHQNMYMINSEVLVFPFAKVLFWFVHKIK